MRPRSGQLFFRTPLREFPEDNKNMPVDSLNEASVVKRIELLPHTDKRRQVFKGFNQIWLLWF